MAKNKQGYNSFRLKELDWWLNTKNSPNEIENKQATKCENFNFDWNKLINSKSYKQYENTQPWVFNSWEIKWLDIIDQKVYATYVNPSWSKVDIMQWTWNVWRNALDNLNSYFFYITSAVAAWETYTITVTHLDIVYWPEVFTYTTILWDTASTVYSQLLSQMNSSPYIKECIWFTNIESPTWTFTEYQWLFFWATSKFRITAVEVWNWTLIASELLTTISNPSLFRSWDDLILLWWSNSPIYYQALADDNAPSTIVAYFWQYINWISSWSNIWVYYNWKLLLANWNDNILYFSKTSSATEPYLVRDFWWYDWWFQRVWWDWKITWLITWENWIYVFKEDEIYYSNSVQDDWNSFAFIFNRITNNWAKDKYCITRVWQDLFYYDWLAKKIRRLSYEQNLTTLRDTAVSDEIDSLLQSQPTITWIQQKLYYSYPNVRFATRSSTEIAWNNDIIYVYNVDRKSWLIETNKAIKQAYWKYFTRVSVNWEVYEEWSSYYSSWEWISKEFDMWDAIDYKRRSEIEIYWKNTDDITLYVDIYIDWTLKKTFTVTDNFWDYFRRKFDMWLEWRFIKIWIRYSWVWYLEINELNFNYKPLKWYNYN